MKRKISAILAADIVKYSKLVADDEEETVRRLAAHRTVFEEATSRYGGRIVNMVGDAILAEFPSSVDAVRSAIDAQETARFRNQAYPEGRRMQIRIGVTLADVMDEDGELFGDGVNIAARLESLAPPGGICVSQTVREQVAGKLSVKFEDIGQQRVKNLPRPIRAYVIPPHREDAASKSWKDLISRKRRVLAAAAVVVAAFAASIVAATQIHRTGQAPSSIAPASFVQQSAAPPPHAVRFDETKVRALAVSQEIPLPRNLKVLVPAATIPARLSDYLGAWGGERRWNNRGRQAILIVESIDEAGTVLGVYAHGAPLVPNPNNQNTTRFMPFAGTISDKGLRFALGPSNYTFMLMPDRSMWGQLDSTTERGRFDLSIVLERIE